MDERGDNNTTRLLLSGDSGDIERKSERPKEPWRGEYVKSIVYGGLDAIITCFSLISSISATTSSSGNYINIYSLFLIRLLHSNFDLTCVLCEYRECVGSRVCKLSSRCNINGVWRHSLR